MGSFQFLWMIVSLVIRSTSALDQVQVINGKLDKQWSDYISGIAGDDYSDDPPSETSMKPRPKATEKKGWTTTEVDEAPFQAVVYAPRQTFRSVDFSRPGTSCGAALITSDKIITLCACVASWWMLHSENVWDGKGPNYRYTKYDINSINLAVAYTFRPKTYNSLLVGEKSVCDLQPRCTNYILGRGNPLEQQVIVVIIPMADPVKFPRPGQYIPWPPAPIPHDGPRDSSAVVIGFGFRSTEDPPKQYYGDYGEEIRLNGTAVACTVNKVGVEDCANEFGQLRREMQERATCFQPALSPKHEICGGLVGSPVVVGMNFQGMLATPINCGLEKGPLLVLDFVKPIQQLIENFTGSTMLNTQNSLQPQFLNFDKGNVSYLDEILTDGNYARDSAVELSPSATLIIIAFITCAHFLLPNLRFTRSIPR